MEMCKKGCCCDRGLGKNWNNEEKGDYMSYEKDIIITRCAII